MLSLLLLVVGVGLTTAQVPGFGGCPEFESLQDFDMNKVTNTHKIKTILYCYKFKFDFLKKGSEEFFKNYFMIKSRLNLRLPRLIGTGILIYVLSTFFP